MLLRRFLCFVLSIALGFQPVFVWADVVPDGSTNTDVYNAANGVGVVDIAAPDSSGVSRNVYSRFDVDSSGLILNNSTKELSQSQLGGQVVGNGNLNGRDAARVILNEVNGGTRSTLSGMVEVHGAGADVIIANPDGITCNGCGFINTPRLTLTTGTVGMGNDGLLSLNVSGGDVFIGANGADVSDVSVFDIISRGISIDGAIAGGDEINLVTGHNAYDYDSGEVSWQGDDGQSPAIAIDSTVFGGMYAGRISIMATDEGVGVKMDGQMRSHTDGMVLTADGRLVFTEIDSAGAVEARARKRPAARRGSSQSATAESYQLFAGFGFGFGSGFGIVLNPES